MNTRRNCINNCESRSGRGAPEVLFGCGSAALGEDRPPIEAGTDEEGRFEFDGLVGEKADIALRDYRNDWPWTYRPITGMELKPDRVMEVEIELIAGVVAEGRVVDAETGEPLEDVSVCVEGPTSRGTAP